MQIFRQPFNTVPQSPLRELFAAKDGSFIAPLDLVTMQLDSSGLEVFQALPLVNLQGAIIGTLGFDIGTVESYDLPLVSSDIKPFIVIKPLGSLIGIAHKIKAPLPSLSLKKGDSVRLKNSSGDISGTVAITGIVKRPYPNFSNQVSAYRIDFPTHLNTANHGRRVEDMSGNLVGMLIDTVNQTGSTCKTLVFPAHLI